MRLRLLTHFFRFRFKEHRRPLKIKLLSQLIRQITAVTEMQPLRFVHDERDARRSNIVLRREVQTDIHPVDTWQDMFTHRRLNHLVESSRRDTL